MDKANKHILIVDDEMAILEVFKALFIREGYQITFVETGQEAISVLQSKRVDLLITDKNLPDINGLDLLKKAKEICKLTEVILITGYASLETVIVAMELDAFDYMLKPLHNIFDIKKKVKQALEKQDMILENAKLLEHLKERTKALELALEERKRVENELIQSEKLAGIGTLAAGIAHEISSPLFGILGLAEAIVEEDDLLLVHQYAGEIVEYSSQIREIVQELSAYSRSAKMEGVAIVEIQRIFDDSIRLVQRSKKLDGIKLKVDIQKNLSLLIKPNELQQLIVNLIKNAVEALEHTKRDKYISFRAFHDDSFIWLRVEDSGQGIPSLQLEKIFEPFFTTKDVGKGTGLGLHIVYRIVNKYQGTISVESSEEHGTVFLIRFPYQSLE